MVASNQTWRVGLNPRPDHAHYNSCYGTLILNGANNVSGTLNVVGPFCSISNISYPYIVLPTNERQYYQVKEIRAI